MGQWTVILGPNGVGKTTLLRSLALALRNANDPSIWPKGTFANAWTRARANSDEAAVDPRIAIKLAETWLIGMDGDAPKNPLSRIVFDVAIAALKTLLDVANIEVAERRVWITEHGKPRLPFSALSDGYSLR